VTWGRTLGPTLASAGATLGTNTGVNILFDQDTGVLANPAGPSAPTWTASAVYTLSAGPPPVTIPLTLTGLPDPADEAFFGAPAQVGTTKPGPPLGPPLVFSCAWGKANPTLSSQGVDYPGTTVCPEPYPTQLGFATVGGGGSNPGTSISSFSQTTIFITGATGPEAAAAFAALKWRMQEMPQTDTDADGVPDPPPGYFTGADNGYPVKGYFDNCPFAANSTQKDSGGINTTVADGIGDACQCGDVTNDGLVNAADKTILSRSLAALPPYGSVGAMPGFNKCVVSSGGACNAGAKTVLSRALASLPPGIGQFCHAATTFP